MVECRHLHAALASKHSHAHAVYKFFKHRLPQHGDALARDVENLPALRFGLRGDVVERIGAIEIEIGLRERGRDGEPRCRRIEPRRVGGCLQALDQRRRVAEVQRLDAVDARILRRLHRVGVAN